MLRLLLFSIILLTSSCAWLTDLTSLGEVDEEIKPRELESFKKEIELNRLWSTKIGKGAGGQVGRLTPKIFSSRIFAASPDGTIKALMVSDGREVWKVNATEFYQGADRANAFGKDVDVITGGLGLGEGLVVLGTAAGEILALSQEDGELIWRAKTSSEVLSPPQIRGDLAVAHSIDGNVSAYNAINGDRKWTYSSMLPPLSLRGTATPLLTSQYVVAAFANGRLAILNRESGLAGFDQAIGISKGRNDLDRLVDIDGNMVLLGQRLYLVGYQSRLVAMNLNTLSIDWSKDVSSIVGLSEGFGNVYAGHADGVISAYDAITGKIAWEVDALTNRNITVPVASSSYLLIGDFQGYLHVIAQSDGRFVGRRKVDRSGLNGGVVSDGARVYVLGNNSNLSAYEIR